MKRKLINSSQVVHAAICLLWLAGTLAVSAATEEKINRRFSVHPDGTLVVEVDFGSLDISTNATSEVVVDVWRKIGRSKKADEEAFLRDNPVTFSQDGDTVTIRAQHDSKVTQSWFSRVRNQNEAKYTITVPAQFNASLRTGGGGIAVADLTGETKAHTGGGGLSLSRLHGPIEGNTGGGGIHAADCSGAIKLNTGGGGVEVIGGSGSLNARTGGGGVTVRRFDGVADLKTGGGGIALENVTGKVEGSTGGGGIDLVLPTELAETVNVSTAGGGISVRVPETTAFNLDAHTSGGGVTSELPVTSPGKPVPGRLEGPVNGGGKAVVLRSGGGNIHLKKL